jgi:two-component system, chemotaxis family, sensor kinase CheA
MTTVDQEALNEFVIESRELLEQAESDLMAFDVDAMSVDQEIINRIFRAVHSVKGVAGFFGLDVISALSHAMESLLMKVRDGELGLTAEIVDVLLKNNDRLKSLVNDVGNSNSVDVSDEIALLKELQETGRLPAAKEAAKPRAQAPKKQKAKPSKRSASIATDDGPPVATEAAPHESAFPRELALTDELRSALVRQGHHLFALSIEAGPDLRDKPLALADFLMELGTLGTIHQCSVDPVDFDAGDDVGADGRITIHVSTVMDAGLSAQAFGVSSDRIAEIPLREDASAAPKPAAVPPPIHKPARPALQADEEVREEAVRDDPAGAQSTDTVRVKTSVLNALMEMAGEMVLARNRLVRSLADKVEDSDGIGPILHQMSTTTTDVQELIMRTRLQPLGSLFGRFRRVVRDLSRKLDKKVILETKGGDVELDRRIIEGLSDPLTHLLRNSLDHGVESPEERLAAGKPASGTVTISAYQEAGMVNIDVADDGHGIDSDRIAMKALEKGLITEEQLSRMSEHEAMNLIHLPGLSTATEVTDVSGRGVGMDVVRTNIEKLGGSIELASTRGVGTTITLKLPLTLAIVSSLIVEAEDQRFALPQVGLEEAIRLKPGEGSERIERIRGADVLRHRGKLLPVVRLADVLGLERRYHDPADANAKPDRRAAISDRRGAPRPEDGSDAERREGSDRRSSLANVQRILVLRMARNRFGLMVDRIVDNEEIVVKPLSRFVRSCPCFSGTTILGDGTIAMILDPAGIVQHAGLKFDDLHHDEAMARQMEREKSLRESMSLVLFSNGTEETFALPLSQISRIEKIAAADIKRVGAEEFLQYRGASLPLLRLHDHLRIQTPAGDDATHYVLIPNVEGQQIGLVTSRVIDAVEVDASFDKDTITGPGIFGSAILDQGIVLLVDIHGVVAASNRGGAQQQLAGMADGRPLRVLVAEDTPIYQAILGSFLTRAGAEVTLAADGQEAWTTLSSGGFDLVVTDIAMPLLDGYGLLARIREGAATRQVPVLAISSIAISDEIGRGKIKEFDGVALKLDAPGLIRSVASAFARGQEVAS